ncbi:MAG: sulfatase-like hydrolase/transferase, partial [Spirochaetales bacterium]
MNTERPNLLVFMCDQLQAAAVRGSDVATPNFDRLASRGVRFTHAYAPNPVCSPSRASFMTGLLPHNHGVRWVTHTVARDQGLLREEHRHWAQDLQDSGYRTMYFGKWHVEHTEDPSRFGWDLDYSLHSKRYRDAAREAAVSDGTDCLGSIRGYVSEPSGYKQRLLYGSSTKQPEKRHLGFLTSLALQEMEGIKGPWCCFVSTPEPHDPFVCSDSSLEDVDIDSLELPTTLYDDLSGRPKMYAKSRRAFDDLSERQHREARACYYASVRELDTELGRLLSFLEKTDQLDETIVVLTSDHGESLGDHGTYFKNVSASESIFGIPMIIAGPGVDRRGDCAARVSLHDLAQTLRELSGNEANDVPDSRSFLRLLRSS